MFGYLRSKWDEGTGVGYTLPLSSPDKLTAEQESERLGYAYPSHVSLEKTYFTTRVYDNLTLPAGIYDAFRVEIGQAAGHNWWCIAFPQMCLPAAEQKTPARSGILRAAGGYYGKFSEIRGKFAIVELFESIGQKISAIFE